MDTRSNGWCFVDLATRGQLDESERMHTETPLPESDPAAPRELRQDRHLD